MTPEPPPLIWSRVGVLAAAFCAGEVAAHLTRARRPVAMLGGLRILHPRAGALTRPFVVALTPPLEALIEARALALGARWLEVALTAPARDPLPLLAAALELESDEEAGDFAARYRVEGLLFRLTAHDHLRRAILRDGSGAGRRVL